MKSTVFAAAVLSCCWLGGWHSSALAETTECTEITALPAVITVQGVYCLKNNLSTGITTGSAIEIQTNNVTIDLNGWKLGGLAGGAGTNANGIYSKDRTNIIIRNGAVRGFIYAIFMDASVSGGSSSGHLVEDVRIDGARSAGILMAGDNLTVRNNQIFESGDHDGQSDAYGIVFQYSNGAIIKDNLVREVSETAQARGIRLINVNATEISGNTVLGLRNASSREGIRVESSADVVVSGNKVFEGGGSGTGIVAGVSSNVDCFDNYVRDYSTAISGCDYTMDNYTP